MCIRGLSQVRVRVRVKQRHWTTRNNRQCVAWRATKQAGYVSCSEFIKCVTMSVKSEDEVEMNLGHITKLQQRAYIKIKTLTLNTVPIIDHSLSEVCSDDTADRSTVHRWHNMFREGRISTADELLSSRQSTAACNTSIAIVATMIDEDRRMAARQIKK